MAGTPVRRAKTLKRDYESDRTFSDQIGIGHKFSSSSRNGQTNPIATRPRQAYLQQVQSTSGKMLSRDSTSRSHGSSTDAGHELVVQGEEPEQMVFHAAARVIGAGARAQNERPVAGLREQQFARGLPQRARRQGAGLFKSPRQSGHPLLRDLQVRINPFVLLVQPRAVVTLLAPA